MLTPQLPPTRSDALWRACTSHLPPERCRAHEPLSRRSSLRIGGPARVWAEPHTPAELIALRQLAAEHNVPLLLVGLGSNTLFPDGPLDALVVRLGGALAAWEVAARDAHGPPTHQCVRVGAGCLNAHLVRALFTEGLVGAEFLSLIPGSMGGAVVMNAGTREADLGGILKSVTVLLPDEDAPLEVEAHALQIAYRHTTLPQGALVLSAKLALEPGDVEAARERARADKARREQTQPYRLASVGSTFANPPGDFAGRLIESVGLKGEPCGGARISDLHANFFINEEGATARDFLTLMARARVRVRAEHGVTLRAEVQYVGFDGAALLQEIESDHEVRHV